MYVIKRELKLNNKETSQMRGNAGFRRFVYNYSFQLKKLRKKGILLLFILGVKCLATCSDGSIYEMPITTKKAKIKLGKFQWHNRNKQIGNRRQLT